MMHFIQMMVVIIWLIAALICKLKKRDYDALYFMSLAIFAEIAVLY